MRIPGIGAGAKLDVRNRVVLITGAGSGIGLALSRLLRERAETREKVAGLRERLANL